jgi:glycosyltransferase involved in cell wall biosynthesis
LNNYPGWVAGMIEDNRCGVVVPPGDASAFADALERLAGNRDDLVTMGRNGRALAERDFDRRQLASQFVSVLERAATGG